MCRVYDEQEPYPEVMQKVQQILDQRLDEFALSLEHGGFLNASVKVLREGSAEHESNQKPRHLQQRIWDRKLKAHLAAPFESFGDVHLTVMQQARAFFVLIE